MDRRQFLTRAGMAGGALTATPMLSACSPPPSPGNPRRLGTVNARNPDAPATLAERGSKSALVIGGGIAGLSAALELGEAGYAVSVCEADSVLGGRLAARELDPGVGRTFSVDHGLHMWFDNYRVFEDIRQRLSLDHFKPYEAVQFEFRNYEPELLFSDPKVFRST